MLSAFSFLFFIGTLAPAYEIDNYTCRFDKAVTDSTGAVNAETNKRLKEAAEKANKFGSGAETKKCDVGPLMALLSDGIASAWMGNLETWADSAPIPKCRKSKKESVYSKFGIFESPMSAAAGLGPVIKVNGVFIGTDKLSHFMTEGLNYYRAFQRTNKIQSALNIGNRDEYGSYGISSTGIHSYGDLAANYQGFEFWRQLTEGPNPYFTCKDGIWSQARQFKWEDYVNPAFDEGINCNLYGSESMRDKVKFATQALVDKNNPGGIAECPLDHEACKKMAEYFQNPEVYATVIHEDCRRIANPGAPPNRKYDSNKEYESNQIKGSHSRKGRL